MKALNLIKKNEDFKRLLYASLISQFGNWFHATSLIAIVLTINNSAYDVSLSILSLSLPALLFSHLIGRVVDKSDRLKLMIRMDFLSGFLTLLYVFVVPHLKFILIVNAFCSVSHSIFNCSKNGFISKIVKSEDRQVANSSMGIVVALMAIFGSSVGGVVASLFSYKIVFIINSLTYILSAILLKSIAISDSDRKKINKKEDYSFIKNIQLIWSLNTVPTVIVMGIIWGIVGGAYNVILPYFGKNQYALDSYGISVLYTVQGVGMLLGCIFSAQSSLITKKNRKKAFLVCYLLQGIFFLLFSFTTSLFAGLASLILMRIFSGIIIPLDSTLIQDNSPEHHLGKIFALHYSVFDFVMQISIFFTGLLSKYFNLANISIIMSTVCIFFASIMLINEFLGMVPRMVKK